jgi:hypothetical protein
MSLPLLLRFNHDGFAVHKARRRRMRIALHHDGRADARQILPKGRHICTRHMRGIRLTR